MARFVGYDHDPLPADRFKLSFGPPRQAAKRKPQPEPVPQAPPPPPRPELAQPRPVAVPKVAIPRVIVARSAPVPVAKAPEPVVAAPAPPPIPQPPRLNRVLRPQLEPRRQPVQNFPTWKPMPAPVVRLNPAPAVQAKAKPRAEAAAGPWVPELAPDMARWLVPVLHVLAALALLAPLGWALGWLGLPASPADFVMTGLGRLAWRGLGASASLALYWVALFPLALGLTLPHQAWAALTGLGVLYWSWAGLHLLLGLPGPWLPW